MRPPRRRQNKGRELNGIEAFHVNYIVAKPVNKEVEGLGVSLGK